jgi:branched-chain amino acid transport system ATP-binding protein
VTEVSAPAAPLLYTESVGVRFGGVRAVDGIDIAIPPDKIVSLIGPNGAGKTTFVNALTGFVPLSSGVVVFGGQKINGMRPEAISAFGLVRTFQNAAVFRSLSVIDNLLIGSFLKTGAGLGQTIFRTSRFRAEQAHLRKRADELVEMLSLGAQRNVRAGDLPYGAQRVLGLGIALMAQPQLLALDEPAAGLSPEEARVMAELIRSINRKGVTVLLIEHNMSLVMSVSDHIIVLKQGRKLAEGPPEAVRAHPEVIEAYLGSDA